MPWDRGRVSDWECDTFRPEMSAENISRYIFDQNATRMVIRAFRSHFAREMYLELRNVAFRSHFQQ